jgi:hypothetical protein
MPGRPLSELLKEKEQVQKQNAPSPSSSGDSWSNMINKVKSDVISSASKASVASKPKTSATVEKKAAPQITKWQEEYQPIFENLYKDKYNWESFSHVARAVNGRYDKLELNDPNVTKFIQTSKGAGEAAKNYYNNPSKENLSNYESFLEQSKNYRTLLANKYTENKKDTYGYVFDIENSSFKTVNQFNKDNDSPEPIYGKAITDLNLFAKDVFDDSGELMAEIESINKKVYYSNHQNEKKKLENKSLRLINPVHDSWNNYALNNLKKEVSSDTRELASDLLISELRFIAKNGTVGDSRRADQQTANTILQKIKGRSFDEKVSILNKESENVRAVLNNMGYYGKLNVVKSYRDKITDVSWFNNTDLPKPSNLFQKIQKDSTLDLYRKDYNDFLKFDTDTRAQVLQVMKNDWKDIANKFGYDVTSKNMNERYLQALVTFNSDDLKGSENPENLGKKLNPLNINSFQKFLENVEPVIFGPSTIDRNLAIYSRMGSPKQIAGMRTIDAETQEKSYINNLKEKYRNIYYGMSKAFKKTFDNAKVTSKISSSIAFPLKYESIDFTIENGYFRGDTEKRKQKEVVEPIFNLLKDGADFTNSKAVLFSNAEINDGLFALQRSEIEERMNNSSMMRLNSKKQKLVTTNEDDYVNQPKGKYTEYEKYDNKTILNDFLSKTKDPSDIRLTYLKNTNVKGFASFIFENKEGVKMQMFVPTENLKGMPLYEQTKLTSDEQIFRAKGNTLQLEDNGPVKQVYLKVNKDNEYVLSYNRLVAGDNRRFEKAIPGAYFGATKLDDVISRANQIVKTVTEN